MSITPRAEGAAPEQTGLRVAYGGAGFPVGAPTQLGVAVAAVRARHRGRCGALPDRAGGGAGGAAAGAAAATTMLRTDGGVAGTRRR
ncbi:hypothetical protein [Micromonospora gifhornensis]|uniref:hypothetical protein n=1 Tax=Micromonospora gifhornensis TaxID=84594 RepID=UPI001EF2F72E|nr:hypothetical protein [Micromonospora gifhornensis]